jgi:hypothetical protein
MSIVYTLGGSTNCNHSFQYSHKGADDLPIYVCTTCGCSQKRN